MASTDPLLRNSQPLHARALMVGERIDLRALESAKRLALAPLTISAGENGCAVLFRYGVIVLFGLTPVEEVSFLQQMAPMVHEPFPVPETEEAELSIGPEQHEGIADGIIHLHALTVERLQVVADTLSKSVVLAHSEQKVSAVFERIEPLAVALQQEGKVGRRSRELLEYIGGALLIQHRTVGRVEVVEKPEVLWEHPDLERLFHRLEDEYELQERQTALENKLSVISRTAETLLELLQNRRSLRVEWYIVILIVVEILLTLYEQFLSH